MQAIMLRSLIRIQ